MLAWLSPPIPASIAVPTIVGGALCEIVAMPIRNERQTAEKQAIGNAVRHRTVAVISSLTASQRFVFSLFPGPPILKFLHGLRDFASGTSNRKAVPESWCC